MLKVVVDVSLLPVLVFFRSYFALFMHPEVVQFIDGTHRSADPVSKSMRKGSPPIVMFPDQTAGTTPGQHTAKKNDGGRIASRT
jgi:hypothetical protein